MNEGRLEALQAAKAAVRTLQDLGYTYFGATHWKPPLGKPPAYITSDAIGEVRSDGATWFGHTPHAFPIGTRFYAVAPAALTTPQMDGIVRADGSIELYPRDVPAAQGDDKVKTELSGIWATLTIAANNPVSHGGERGLRDIMLRQAGRISAVLAATGGAPINSDEVNSKLIADDDWVLVPKKPTWAWAVALAKRLGYDQKGHGAWAAESLIELVLSAAPAAQGPPSAKCGRCGAHSGEACDAWGCGYLNAGNGAPTAPAVVVDELREEFHLCHHPAYPDPLKLQAKTLDDALRALAPMYRDGVVLLRTVTGGRTAYTGEQLRQMSAAALGQEERAVEAGGCAPPIVLRG